MSFLDNTGLSYFYSKLKEKFIRSVTTGNDILTPDIDGNVTIINVPTADNLTSPDNQTSYDKYIEPTKHEARIHLPNYTVRDDEVIDGDQTFEVLKNMLTFIAGQRTNSNPKKSQSSNH